ncbi:uncharacterized protein LY89DRAFT_413077 [Mollisia scopiformis]|uniref:Zn(2)-C6 fungal-type domain-containing protein n=1 Tax=Mollisia scopiformis TaxID=149040 RepID=A0A132B208_MOLSC|nr:uncharacterized protein LY89DRAFT_413077 [Mollisia scopiformis]KUJ06341.1 hypothetical protein LY89DRAFT_413077 [Mollisia scopiformis]
MSAHHVGNEVSDSTNSSSLRKEGLRACGTCVKAKVKCVPNAERGRCQRCHRLDKPCHPSTSSSRKRPQSAQVAQLEKKLDSLVNLLTTPKDNVVPVFSSSDFPMVGQQRHDTSQDTDEELALGPGQSSQPVFQACASNTSHPSDDWDSEIDPFDFGLERQECAFLLLEFRTQMSPQFPFVVISPDATSESLLREKPMLWKAVMTAASYHKPIRQEAMGWKLMEDFSTRLLMKAEKSLDLLQALLVHLAWYHYHSAANPQATNLLFLAKSLLINLGYHRSRTSRDRPKLNLNLDGSEGLSIDEPNDKTSTLSRSLEEWRALAGCFFLSAMTTSSCRRMDPLLYTPHLEAVCKTLTEMCEYESDRMIMPLISIQNVVLKMSSSLQELDVSKSLSAIPIRMYMTALQNELNTIKSTMPTSQVGSATLLSCFQVAEISLYEVGLYRAFWQESDKDHRLKTLFACLIAIRTYFDTHFSPGVRVPASFPYFMWIHNGYALLMGAKLCFSKAGGWDLSYARSVVDYNTVVNHITQKLEAILRLRTPHGKSEIFTRYIKQLQCKQMRRLVSSTASFEQQRPANISPAPLNDTPAAGYSLENHFASDIAQSFHDPMFMDDNFWQGLLDEDNDWMMLG